MIKSIIIAVLLFLEIGVFAQENLTFFKNSQAGIYMFHDFTINKDGGNPYKIIGSDKFFDHQFRLHFVYLEYDSSGNVAVNEPLSQVFYQGLGFWDGYGLGWFLKNGEMSFIYSTMIAAEQEDFNCLLSKEKKLIWSDIGIVLETFQDSFYLVVKDDKIKKIKIGGKIIWEIQPASFFKSGVSDLRISFTNNQIFLQAVKSKDNKQSFYIRSIDASGKLKSEDTIVFDQLFNVELIKAENGYIASGIFKDSNQKSIKSVLLLDTNANIVWEQNLRHSSMNYYYTIDNNKNYHIITDYASNKDSTTNFLKLYKVNSNGKLLKEITFEFPENASIDKFSVLEDGGYFILGNLFYFQGYGEGYLMRTDSNLKVYKTNSVKETQHNSNNAIVFPNPTNSTTLIHLPSNSNKTSKFHLYTITGQSVRAEEFSGSRFEFNRGDLPNGIYIYTVSSGYKVYNGKLILE